MKRTPLKRTPFKRKPPKPKTSKGLFDHLKKEKKVDEWTRVRTEILDPYFIANNLYDVCELTFSKCIGNKLPLQYAHSKKRGDIAKEEPERTRELCEVVRACTVCHDHIEYLPEKDGKSGREHMYDIVVSTINKRNRRLARWKKVSA